MKKLFTPILTLTCIFLSCGMNTPEEEIRAIGIERIEVLKKSENEITFNAHITLPTPCWDLHKKDISLNEQSYDIKLFYKSKDVVCVQVLDSREVPVTLSIPHAGDYRFSFWHTDSTKMDTTIHF